MFSDILFFLKKKNTKMIGLSMKTSVCILGWMRWKTLQPSLNRCVESAAAQMGRHPRETVSKCGRGQDGKKKGGEQFAVECGSCFV
jgi:hypothetical protein